MIFLGIRVIHFLKKIIAFQKYINKPIGLYKSNDIF